MRSSFIAFAAVLACQDMTSRAEPRRVEPGSLEKKVPPGVKVLRHGQPNRPDVASLVSTTWCESLASGAAMSERLHLEGLVVGTRADDNGLSCTWSVACPDSPEPPPTSASPAGSSEDEPPPCFEKLAMQLSIDCKPELHVRKNASEWIEMHLGVGGTAVDVGDGASYIAIPQRAARLEMADNGCALSFYAGAMVVTLEDDALKTALVEFATAVAQVFPPEA